MTGNLEIRSYIDNNNKKMDELRYNINGDRHLVSNFHSHMMDSINDVFNAPNESKFFSYTYVKPVLTINTSFNIELENFHATLGTLIEAVSQQESVNNHLLEFRELLQDVYKKYLPDTLQVKSALVIAGTLNNPITDIDIDELPLPLIMKREVKNVAPVKSHGHRESLRHNRNIDKGFTIER